MTLQKLYPAIEQELLCSICSQAVTNPLCPSCLTTEMEAWLTMYPDLRNALMDRLKKLLDRVKYKFENSNACIKCDDKKASICPYCFTEYVFRQLKSMDVNHRVLKEFLQFFNFDFEHDGYYKEGEKLGAF